MAVRTADDPAADRGWTADVGWLAVIVVVALAIRIERPWSLVFLPTHINLLETDAWYHLRTIENLVRQFPHRLQFDPYASPAGQFVPVAPLFDYIAAAAALIAGFGHPSPERIAVVAVFLPPVLGALTVVLVYGVARLAAGSLGGLLAAALAAILPGMFLDRTLLGYVDHHALEACLSVAVLYCTARPLCRGHSVVRAGLWLGLALAAYRLAWTSSALLVAVLTVWLAVHAALQSWKPRAMGDATRFTSVAAMIALVATLLFRGIEPSLLNLQVASLLFLLLVAAGAEAARHGLRAGWWSPRLLAGGVLAAAAAMAAVFLLAFPDTAASTLQELSRFNFAAKDVQVLEARPLFMFEGVWSLRPAWEFFRSGFILGILAVGFFAVRWAREGEPLDLLLVVWTSAMYAATMGQNRFGYYLVPAIAIVVGCASARLIRAARRAGEWQRSAAVVVVAAAAFGLNLVPAIWTTGRSAGIPTEWFPAFAWLRHQSAEPFGDPDYYYARYDAGPVRMATSTVMVWWDYGYEVIAAAHRVPTANPTQSGADLAGRFFIETDEARARADLDAQHARYVFVDELLPFRIDAAGRLMGKFETMAAWAGTPTSRFYDTFLVPGGASYRAAFLYFPDYYRTMAFRLGVLGGGGVTPARTDVVSWVLQPLPDGHTYRIVTGLEPYSTYEAAAARLAQLGPGNHAIVGQDPQVSPVPLEPVRTLRLAYRTAAPGAFRQGAVQIFEAQ